MKKRILIIAFVFLLFTGCGNDDYLRVAAGQGDLENVTESSVDEMEDDSGTIFVQLTGEVLRPGVYEMQQGARLYEAIELSGGLLDDAAEEINQVQILSDGQLIHIPSKEEFIKESERQKEEDDGLIDLNQATASELSSLPGIGENKANQIISFRDMNGSFSSKEDLMKVPGIKEGTYSKLEAYITVR